MCEASADSAGGSGVSSKRAPNEAGVWLPMDRAAKKDWSWVDWMRFLFYRQASALPHTLLTPHHTEAASALSGNSESPNKPASCEYPPQCKSIPR